MSIAQFKLYADKVKFARPSPEWAVRWLRRLFEFYRQPPADDFPFSTAQLIEFLKAMRDRGVPAWQRHQAALTAARYQLMLSGRIDSELDNVIRKLAELAQAEKRGVAAQADKETHFPANEPKEITQLRQTLRRRRYKYDTEKAYVGWCQRFLQANPGREIDSLGEPELRTFLNDLVMHSQGGVAASTLKQAKSALLFLFQEVLGRELGFWIMAKPPSRLSCQSF